MPRVVILCVLLTVRAIPGPATAGTLIDHVWSGHPVNFALLTERGHQFIAYYDANRRLTVAGRRLDSDTWRRVQPPGVPVRARQRESNVMGWDSHNDLVLALDRDGCLHVSGNMHNDPLVYYRTSQPFAVETLERVDRMTGARERSCTYPVFFRNAGGDLLFRYRDGSSGRGSDRYNIYDPARRAWRPVINTPLLDGEGARNAYALDPVLGPDGRFHLVWVWRDTPNNATNHTLSYARSRDFVHWETSRDETLLLPIRAASGDVIDPAGIRQGLTNMGLNLGFDARQRPVVVYHRYDAHGRSQAFIARPTATTAGSAPAWELRQLSNWNFRWALSGPGSIASEVTLGTPQLAADGSLLVDFWTRKAGAGRWRLHADTLECTATLPARSTALPAELAQAASSYPNMEVQLATSRSGGRLWVLRWETLPRNRDRPRETVPPPSELRLYEFSDTAADTSDPTE
ncbi:MAG TPA: BNR repeat-containing protein [Opitutaceae bacterium]